MQVGQLLLGGRGTICAVVGVVVLTIGVRVGVLGARRTAQELQEVGATRP